MWWERGGGGRGARFDVDQHTKKTSFISHGASGKSSPLSAKGKKKKLNQSSPRCERTAREEAEGVNRSEAEKGRNNKCTSVRTSGTTE